jgi:hypothetical protein
MIESGCLGVDYFLPLKRKAPTNVEIAIPRLINPK